MFLILLGPAAGTLPAQMEERDLVIRSLSFQGNHAIPDPALAAAISTTASSWFARAFLIRSLGLGEKRYFNELEFRRDVLRLEVFYKRSGYPDVTVDTLVRRTTNDVYVSFRITEGRPILVAAQTV